MEKYVVVFLLICLSSCGYNETCVVEGRLPGKEYDGEIIYFVPVKNATVETVDSTYIENASFRFEKKIRQQDIVIVRTRPILRLRLQELLIVREAGKVEVQLDSISSATGTPLNDALQQWKEVQTQKPRISADYSTYNYTFVRDNKENILGRFVYSMVKHSFTDEQKQELNMTDEY